MSELIDKILAAIVIIIQAGVIISNLIWGFAVVMMVIFNVVIPVAQKVKRMLNRDKNAAQEDNGHKESPTEK